MQIQEFVRDDLFSPALIAKALRTTQAEIADTLGLPRDALSRKTRVCADRTQIRLRQMMEIIHRVAEYDGSLLAAYAWYRSEPLVGFGGTTPVQLVREGRADWVHAHLDRVMAGGYA
jgi:hypothetical protein